VRLVEVQHVLGRLQVVRLECCRRLRSRPSGWAPSCAASPTAWARCCRWTHHGPGDPLQFGGRQVDALT
jgi:hypothetical protein